MKQVRQSNFELLRLLSMFMILALHANFFALHSPSFEDCVKNPANTFFQNLLEFICIPSVNVFVLISGYFSIRPGVRNVSNLLFQYFYYSIGILLLFVMWGGVTLPDILKTLLITFSFNNYWFLGSYLCLMFLSPFLNAYINQCSKQNLLYWIILFFMFQFCTDIFYVLADFKGGASCLSFVGLYLFGRYIRLYGGALFEFNKYGDLAIYVVICLASICLIYAPNEFLYGILLSKFMAYNSPLVIISSIFLFLFFSKLKFTSKWVNRFSESSFAIYLIHCHILLIYNYYIPFFKHLSQSYSSFTFFAISFGMICLIFMGCIFIDQIRIWIWQISQNRIITRIEKIQNVFFSFKH